MKKYNVALIGTFDIESIEEQFSTIIFEKLMKENKNIDNIYLFSPNEGKKPFYNRKIYSVNELDKMIMKNNINAIIMNGKIFELTDKESVNLSAIKLWLYPVIVGKKYKIPVLYNAIDIPFEFEDREKVFIKDILMNVDYISVRNKTSKSILEGIGLTECQVVPDTLNYISKIFSKEELQNNLPKIKEIKNINDYIVLQYNSSSTNDSEYIDKTKRLIDYITKIENQDIVLLPMDCNNSTDNIKKLYNKKNKKIHIIEKKQTPYNILSVISSSKGYIGNSYYGLEIANVYNVPLLAINQYENSAISDYLESIEKKPLDVTNIYQLLSIYKNKFNIQEKFNDKEMIKSMHTHFDNMIKVIKKEKSNNKINIELQMLNDIVSYSNELKEKDRIEHRLNEVLEELRLTLASKSWKLTKPIRKITSLNKKKKEEKIIEINSNSKITESIDGKIAIQAHIFYTDLLDEIYENIKEIPYEYDLYISTQKGKKKTIEAYFKNKKMNNVTVEIFENKGRDILPFILQMKDRISEYKYICHIHTKKSKHKDYGDRWRKHLYWNLFGDKRNIESIYYLFKNKKVGLIYPNPFSPVEKIIGIGDNKENIDKLCRIIGIYNEYNNEFPSGSMFWAKTNAIKQYFDKIDEKEFEEEDGQTDGTFAHAFERTITILAKSNGYQYIKTVNRVDHDN